MLKAVHLLAAGGIAHGDGAVVAAARDVPSIWRVCHRDDSGIVFKAVHLLAAGGIGSGRQIAAALALGAAGAWTGSMWLTTQEALVIPLIKEKLVAAGSRDTVRTRALTGKPARLLRTGWIDAWEDKANPDPLPMPLQYMLTADAVDRLHKFSDTPGARHLLWSPVGQIVGRMNDQPSVAELMSRLKSDFNATTAKLGGMRVPE